jgi:hypothetical protein
MHIFLRNLFHGTTLFEMNGISYEILCISRFGPINVDILAMEWVSKDISSSK